MAWSGKTRSLSLSLSFFWVTFVLTSDKSIDGWLGAWVQNLWKEVVVTVTDYYSGISL
jgi:hypothetical protein